MTAGEALAAFYAARGLPADPAAAPTWTCRVGPLTLRFPNWRWRRQAIARHDLHHLLTGYPCTLRGEMQMAAWEFGAGRFPHPAATAFCLPLALAGLVAAPRRTMGAWRAGRSGRSLYAAPLDLDAPMAALRRQVSGLTATASGPT